MFAPSGESKLDRTGRSQVDGCLYKATVRKQFTPSFGAD